MTTAWHSLHPSTPLEEALQSVEEAVPTAVEASGVHALGRELENAHLAGRNLSGADLSGADLTGADLSGCDLSNAVLLGACLRGAVLSGAKLCRAELAASDLRDATLDGCDATEAGFAEANLDGASLFEAVLSHASFSGASLKNADLRRSRCVGARFVRSDLRHADLTKADLSEANLVSARVDETRFHETDLRRARLRDLKGFAKASFLQADIRDVDFSHAHLVRRFIMDQNYIAEFRSQSRVHGVLYWLWWVTSDCGRSLLRWSAWIAALAVTFGVAYRFVEIDYGDHETWLSPFYFSVVTLTTLGFGDVLPRTDAAQLLVILEVTTGYMALGGLLSIFANKMARRAE